MSDPIPPYEHLLSRERCSIHFRDIEGTHVGNGELVLTERHLIFQMGSGALSPGQLQVVFSAPLHAIRTSVTKPFMGRPKLEVLHNARIVRFSVLQPTEWVAAIEGQDRQAVAPLS